MSSGDDLATEYADTMVGSIASIMARYDGTAHDDECERASDREALGYDPQSPCECQDRARNELDESYALEVVAERGEPFSVLLTYGSPTAWVEWSGRRGTASAELRVTWSSDVVVRRSSPIRELVAHYAEMMGDE